MIARNIVANAIGGAWTAGLTVIAIPVQARLLGVEAYAVVALMLSAQAIAGALDFGVSTAVVRIVASDVEPRRSRSIVAVSQGATIYYAVAALIAAAVWAAAPWLSQRWLRLEHLDPAIAVGSIRRIALVLGIRWPTTVYSSVLAGLQTMRTQNALKAASATLRHGGGIVVLCAGWRLEGFLYWQVAVSVAEVAAYAVACAASLSPRAIAPSLRRGALADLVRSSATISLIGVQGIALTQADRVALARAVPLPEVGRYSIAYNLALGISLIQGFVTSALMPALSQDRAASEDDRFVRRYGRSTRIMGLLIGAPTMVMVFLPREALTRVLPTDTATSVAPLLAVLGAGFFLNGLPAMAVTASYAAEAPRRVLLANIPAVVLYVPAMGLVTSRWGASGAAWAWLALNAYYVAVLPPLIERVLPRAARATLWWRNAAPAIVAVVAAGCLGRAVSAAGAPAMSALAASCVAYLVLAWLLLDRKSRAAILALPRARPTP